MSRPRISRHIDKGVQRGTVTVVSGAPGAGKTVALAQWAAEGRWPGPVAWLTLDEYDDTDGRFWRHLAASLARAGVSMPAWVAGDSGAPVRIASALAAQRPPAVLVLDNLHVVRSPGLVDGLSYLLGHAGPGLRVVVGSRADKPLLLRQHVLTGDLAEIRGGELAFTGPETRFLLRQSGVNGYRESILPLLKRTEGWAAGLRFVMIALRDASDTEACEPGSAEHLINGYLASEAIETQPPRIQDFLLRCSVPELITPDLARTLTSQADSAAILDDLVGDNLFIQPDSGGTYRFHTLLRAALLARLRAGNPCLLDELLRGTACWHRRYGRLEDAVRYAASAGDARLAARIIVDELAVSSLLDLERGQGLAGDLHSVVADAEPTRPPDFACAAAIAVARHDYGAGASWLARAGETLRSLPPDQEVPSRLGVALIRFELARADGDPDALYAAASEQEAVLHRLPADTLDRRQDLTAHALSSRGYAALWLGRFEEAVQALTEALALPAPAVSDEERADCLGRLALAEAVRGQLGRAMELAERSARTVPAGGAPDIDPKPLANLPSEVALAWVHVERDEIPSARAALKRVEAGLRARQDRAAAAAASLVAAHLYLAEGRFAQAVDMLTRPRQDWSPPAWLDHELALAEARAEAMGGNPEAALDAVGRCAEMPGLAAATARAYAWLSAGNTRAAQRELRYVFAITSVDPARALDRAMLDALLIDARIHYANGDRAAGRDSLARALRLARGEDVRLPFEMEHSWLFPVLRADAELARSYQMLSRPDVGVRGDSALRSLAAVGPALIEPLTERELEVLQRVAQLLSTAEIANELYISVNTVKTHLKSVHRKLAVTHRREAVRRARQLKLL